MRTFDKRYFRLLMADKEITLRGLAAKMGIGHSQLSLTMSGTRRLQLTEAAQLADLLGVSLQDVAEHAGAYDVPPSHVAKSGHTRHFEELNWLQNRNSADTVASLQQEKPPFQGEEMSKNQQSSTTLELMPTEAPQSGQNTALAQASRAEVNLMPAPTNPGQVVAYAMAHGAPVSEIREFMALQREWEASEARKAFVAAKAAFKAENVVVVKDKENLQYKSRYSSLGNLVNTVAPYLSKHGLSADWDVDQTNGLKITCILSHALGHSEKVSMQVPPDTAGSKNPIQQIKSAITYAKTVTFESVCGLAVSDTNVSDDGNGAYSLDTALADKWIEEIQACQSEAEMKGVWTVAIKAIREANDGFAYDEVKRIYGEHLAKVKGGAA